MKDVSEVEFQLFLDGVHLRYGYDFREYAEASLKRRIGAILSKFQMEDTLLLLRRMIKEPDFFQQVLAHLTVTTSEMFRDPEFFRHLRETVVPILKTYPTINIWIAGCSTGEEVYSLAILLKEEELYERSTIFATDINPRAIKAAKDGIYPVDAVKTHTRNYQDAGGREAFSKYYTADYGLAKMNSDLTSNVVFHEHNLVHDHVFAECHLILCRNVLIYFNKELQDRVLELFAQSLRFGGFLGLGSKENLKFSSVAKAFDVVNDKWRVYRRNGSEARNYGTQGGLRGWS